MNKLVFASATCLAVGSTPTFAATIDEVFAFGDSLNDCCINPAAPFTNGSQTWLVEFASLIGATYADAIEPGAIQYNYATGGAQSGAFNAIAPGGVPQPNGLLSQIAQFKADAPTIGADDLAVIWVGTNDIWASSYESDTLFGLPGLDIVKPLGKNPDAKDLANYVAGNIQSAVVDLRDLGFGSVLLLTPYDIGDSGLFDVASGPAQNTEYSEALLNVQSRMIT